MNEENIAVVNSDIHLSDARHNQPASASHLGLSPIEISQAGVPASGRDGLIPGPNSAPTIALSGGGSLTLPTVGILKFVRAGQHIEPVFEFSDFPSEDNGFYVALGSRKAIRIAARARADDQPRRPGGAPKKGVWTDVEFHEWYAEAVEAYADDTGGRPTMKDLCEALGVKTRTTARERLRDAELKWSSKGPVSI
ncbi:MAG: hypothetical protein U0893_20120 [Chloroflexota bacterium]